MCKLSKVIKRVANLVGYDLKRKPKRDAYIPVEFSKIEREVFHYIFDNKLTLVSPQRLIATILASKYVLSNKIDGDFVECGVWRGGNALAAKMIFEAYDCEKKVYLFDTFSGMTEPTNSDLRIRDGVSAKEKIKWVNEVCYASLSDVKKNFEKARVDMNNVKFVVGDVSEALLVDKNLPKNISVLRLDTDWYESTLLEMKKLYPLLSTKGVLLIDDYGYWDEARKAIEHFFQNSDYERPYMQLTDQEGRSAIK